MTKLAYSMACVAAVSFAHATSARAEGVATPEAAIDSKSQARVDALPWRDSLFVFSQALGASTFDQGQLSYDPYYAWSFDLRLYWHFSERSRLRIQQGLEVELTDSDTTTSRQRPLLSDLDVRFDQLLWETRLNTHDKLAISGTARAVAPLSLASQAAGVFIGVGPRAGLAFSFDDWLQGSELRLGGGYVRRFAQSNTVRSATPYPCFAGSASAECTYLGSITSPRDIFDVSLSAQTQITRELSALALIRFDFWRGYPLATADVAIDSGGTLQLEDQSATHFHNSRTLQLALSYALVSFLDVSLSIDNVFSERSIDGKLRAPLRPVDTAFGLAFVLLLDNAYVAASHQP